MLKPINFQSSPLDQLPSFCLNLMSSKKYKIQLKSCKPKERLIQETNYESY